MQKRKEHSHFSVIVTNTSLHAPQPGRNSLCRSQHNHKYLFMEDNAKLEMFKGNCMKLNTNAWLVTIESDLEFSIDDEDLNFFWTS